MANAVFDHFDNMLGTRGDQLTHLNFEELGLPSVLGTLFDHCFSEDEIRQAIMDMPCDKAPGPDGFTGLFFRTAWSIIKTDILRAFQAVWSLDGRSFFLVNQAYMILLRKKQDAASIGDYRPISLIHSFAKLLAKVLARRLAPHMNDLVRHNLLAQN